MTRVLGSPQLSSLHRFSTCKVEQGTESEMEMETEMRQDAYLRVLVDEGNETVG